MSTTATGTRFSMFSDEDLRHLSNGVKANIAGCESGLLYGARSDLAGPEAETNRSLLLEIEEERRRRLICSNCGATCVAANPEPPGWSDLHPDEEWDLGDITCPNGCND